MAPGDGRLMTWQVLLTVSMVLTPAFAHGKRAAPTLYVCMYVRGANAGALIKCQVNVFTVRLVLVLILILPTLF